MDRITKIELALLALFDGPAVGVDQIAEVMGMRLREALAAPSPITVFTIGDREVVHVRDVAAYFDAQLADAQENRETLLSDARALFRRSSPRDHKARALRYQDARHVRTPAWADRDAIRAVYREARRLTEATGIPHHVDHEIPLRGALVSGLHVHTNLRVLTKAENSTKRNRFEIEP